MNLLLDTHVVLWIANEDGRLSPDAMDAIADPTRVVFVSAASAWEVAIKSALGKLAIPGDWEAMLAHYRFEPLDITAQHALAIRDLPAIHRDPFDRMLVAQARVERLVLVSHDAAIRAYDVPVLSPMA